MHQYTIFFCIGSVLLVFVSVPPPTTAIECWACVSDLDPKCDPFESKSIRRRDCDHFATGRDKPTLCKKIKSFDKLSKTWYTERGCVDNGHKHYAQPGCKNGKNHITGNDETICFCDVDLCNGSNTFRLNIAGAIALGIAYVARKFYF